ncbi:MAG TPA: C25 family peptidase propeptide domain-containing protein, partial [candidate division Zixibacteria bacterium]|nr:C25 family peptidase propeptide domain-containing protein [candidate division Zixibacteria bacterium]
MGKVKGKFKLITLVVVLMTSSKVIAANNEYSDFKVLSSDATGLNLIYQVPGYEKSKVTVNNYSYNLIEIEKSPLLKEKGKPQIPVRIIAVGVPPEGNIETIVSDFKFTEISGINLAIQDTLGENFEPSPKKTLFPQNYSTSDQFYPQDLVEVERIMWVRNQKVARVRIFPIQYNPARNTVRYYSEISLKVNFVGPKTQNYSQEKDSFDKIFQNMLINFDQAKNWRKSQTSTPNYFPANPLASAVNCYKIITKEDGLHRINASTLQSAGIDISQIDPRTIQIFNGGGKALPLSNFVPRPALQELAIQVAGENDSVFNGTDYILFYGWSVNNWGYDSVNNQYNHYTNNYTTQNVYWLTWGGSFPNKRMTIKDGSLADSNPVMVDKTKARLHLENDTHLAVISGEIFDYSRWFWLTTQSTSLFLSLSGIITSDTAKLKVNARFVPPTIIVNSDPAIITRTFGDTTEAKTASLIEGLNQIELNFSRVAYIDYYEVEYSSRAEVRDGQLFFESPDSSGVLQYNITGVTSTSGLLDITDLFDVKQITNYPLAGSNLSFQDTLLANQKKRFFLVADNRQKTPLLLSQVVFANLKDTLDPSNSADFIVIS